MIEIVLVRHGESVRNLSCDEARQGNAFELERQMRDEQDECPWPLTSLGVQQAELAGRWLREHLDTNFDAGYVSPFVRARQTAEALGLGMSYHVDDRIREREWGEYTTDYSSSQYLSDLAVCADLRWKTAFPGAESVMDLVPRVSAFVQDALRATPAGRIVAVTHGGTIRALQVVLERLGPDPKACPDRRLSNCCVVMYRLHDVDPERETWHGEVRTAHPALPGQPQTDWQPVDRSS